MDIKQANIQETDTGFRTSGYGFVCIQIVPPDPKVRELAAKSTCMDGGCILNKLSTPKSIYLPTFSSHRESVSQNNEGQVYIEDNNTSVAFPTMVHPVIENVYTRSNFHFLISKSFYRPSQNQHPLCHNQTLPLAAWKYSGNSILQKAYQTKQLICLKVAEDRAHCTIIKRDGECRVAGFF